SLAAPSALECAGVHVVDEDSLVEEAVGDEDLPRILIELERADTRRENRRLLVILLHLVGGYLRTAMSEVLQELPLSRKLDDAVAGRGSREPHVLLAVNGDRLQAAGPAGVIVRPAPRVHDVAVGVELQDLRPEHAALAPRRRGRRRQFVRTRVDAAVNRPDVVVFVDVDVDNLLHAPFVRERLGPEGIDAISR